MRCNNPRIDRRSPRIIPPQRPQLPIILHSPHQRIMIINRRILIPPRNRLKRIPNQRSINMVRRTIRLTLIIRHHHRQILRERLVLEPRHPFSLEIVGHECGIGVVAVVVERGDVIPPLWETAAVEIGLEFSRGHDVGAAGGVGGDVAEVDGRDMFGGVGVFEPVGRGGGAAAGVILRVHFPAHALFFEEVEEGGAGEVVGCRGAVVFYAEGGAGDGGEVVWEGRVLDAEVLGEEAVVV